MMMRNCLRSRNPQLLVSEEVQLCKVCNFDVHTDVWDKHLIACIVAPFSFDLYEAYSETYTCLGLEGHSDQHYREFVVLFPHVDHKTYELHNVTVNPPIVFYLNTLGDLITELVVEGVIK